MELAGPSNKYHYNPKLKSLATKLRQNMTKSEAVLWKHCLSSRKTHGLSFNRQRPVLNYIVDFMCRKIHLVIEVDGISHLDESVQNNDAERQLRLEAAGFRVIRFTSKDVLENLEVVKQEIENTCEQILESYSHLD